MFLKYFFILLNKFDGFKKDAFVLFLLSIVGGILELFGIAMIFPVILVLTSSDSAGGQLILDFCLRIFPSLTTAQAALLLSIVMVAVFLFKNVFMIYCIYLQNDFVKKWTDFVNKDITEKLLFAPYASVKNMSYGDKNTLLYTTARDVALGFILRTVILLANGVVAFFIAALLFVKFTVPAFLSTLFILCFAYFENIYFKNNAKKLGDINVKLLSDFADDVNFTILSQKEIVISGKQEYFIDYLMDSSKKISDNFSKQITYGNSPLYVTEIGVIIAFLILVLSILVFSDATKASILSSLAVITLMVLRLVPQLNKVLISMYAINSSRQRVFWFLEKYDEISKFSHEKYKDLPALPFNSSISLENVCFSYEENKPSLSDINLTINKGEFIGIMGLSGSGKTTLADIITGVYSPNSGKILIDGVEVTHDKISSWQKNISFLPQESVFMHDTVLKNVAWGIKDDEINVEKVKAALEAAESNADINSMPDLSLGQKHRVALARAYYREFQLLVLDEATSDLDIETENSVMENILKLKGQKTIVMIAHRLSTLKNCDRIFYLENGRIKDSGTLVDLKNRNPEIDKMLRMTSFE